MKGGGDASAAEVNNFHGATVSNKTGSPSTVCNLCGVRKSDSMLNLSDNFQMRQTIIPRWKMPEDNAEHILSCICVQCVFKINAHMDVTHLHRLTNGQKRSASSQAHEEKSNLVQSAERITTKRVNLSAAENKLKNFDNAANDDASACNVNGNVDASENDATENQGEAQICVQNESTHALAALKNVAPFSLPYSSLKEVRVCLTRLPLNIVQKFKYSSFSQSSETTAHPSNLTQSSTSNSALLDINSERCKPALITESGNADASENDVTENQDYAQLRMQNESTHALAALKKVAPISLPYSSLKEVRVCLTGLPLNTVQKIKCPSFPQFSETTAHIVTAPSNLTQSSTSSSSLLDIYSERCEPALFTESGGKINNYRRLKHTPTQLSCQHCNRAYRHKYYYTKHIRRCAARLRIKLAAKKIKNVNKDANVSENNTTENQEQCHPNRVFHCSECSVTVDSMIKLRSHKRSHVQCFYCGICGNEFTARHEYDFHRVVCEAQYVAKLPETLDTVSNVPIMALAAMSTAGRMTRARSRALSTVTLRSHCINIAGSTSLRNNTYWDGESDDDDVSVADTMYSKRMRFAENWVEDPNNNYGTICEQNWNDYDDDMQITTYKEYDLYLLNRLKREIHLGVFRCYAPSCNYRTDTLLNIMLHDYVNHFKSSWFYCKKCGRVFTSKVFLDYHQDRQSGGRFICFKCGDIFEFQHELDHHLILHKKCINYRCNYCNFEFLTINELLQHCEREQHDPNAERKCIQLQIVNKVAPLDVFRRGPSYCVKILDMQLPRLPSKMLHKYKRNLYRIGVVEFENQKNPNCCGWK